MKLLNSQQSTIKGAQGDERLRGWEVPWKKIKQKQRHLKLTLSAKLEITYTSHSKVCCRGVAPGWGSRQSNNTPLNLRLLPTKQFSSSAARHVYDLWQIPLPICHWWQECIIQNIFYFAACPASTTTYPTTTCTHQHAHQCHHLSCFINFIHVNCATSGKYTNWDLYVLDLKFVTLGNDADVWIFL